ncbi:class I SAM-dependent rRNA methyltransferase [Myxococcota bacterium]|nr:class I SAM-dependent rRNA methyltransferase [Myxococcota bacterium]
MLQITLQRNLRKTLLQGHPWVYREALRSVPQNTPAQICRVFDHKQTPLAWAIFDPVRPLALRILSTQKPEPTWQTWEERFAQAQQLRAPLKRRDTTGYRLFHGEGDRLPGLVCDIYDRVAALQFDGEAAHSFWCRDELLLWLRKHTQVHTILDKSRFHNTPKLLYSEEAASPQDIAPVTIRELGVTFLVDVFKGQKTGFFFDQRENRQYIRELSQGLSVLNLFSYTGGFSVYAGCGGATQVLSVDIAQAAVDAAHHNWLLNHLPPDLHQPLCADVFAFLASPQQRWDVVIVDPPSMAHAEEQKERAIQKYTEAFALATKCVKPHGHLMLSSCSSHISFDDFSNILEASMSRASRTAQILHISGQGIDHPFPHICPELRYLQFVHCRLN